MTSTTFVPGTVITSPWLNDVNKAVYIAIGDGSAVPSTAADVRTNLAVETQTANRAAFSASSGSSLVGYLPSGTGAVATTVQTKLRESVSVLDFGADNTNGTVLSSAANAAAIQACITYCQTNHKAVYFPAGTYLITTITMFYGVTVFGEGRWNTYIYSTTNAPIISFGTSAKAQIYHLTVKGSDNAAHTAQHGLYFNSAGSSGWYDSIIEDVEISYCGGDGLYFNDGAGGGFFYNVIRDVKVFNNHKYGFEFTGGLLNTNLFQNIVFTSNGLGGAYYHDLASQTQEQKYDTCYFEANGAGTASGFGIWIDQLSSMLSLDNCFFEGNGTGGAGFTSWGVKIKQPSFLSVKGCTFAAHAQHIYIDGMQYGTYIDIQGNLLVYSGSLVPTCLAAVYLDSCYNGLINYTGNADSSFSPALQIVRTNYSSIPLIQNRTFQATNNINGQSKVLNGTFLTDTTSWAPTDCTIASVPGGVSGNCLQVTRTANTSQIVTQNVTVTAGRLYRLSYSVKSGTSGNEGFSVYDGISASFVAGGTTSAGWVTYTSIFRAVSNGQSIILKKDSATAGTMLFDEVSITEVAQEANTDVAIAVSGNGGLVRSTIGPVAAGISASATVTIPMNIPVNCKIVGVQMIVSTALTGGETWTAKLNNGSDVETIVTAAAVAKNTQVSHVSSLATTATTNIVLTKSTGGSFTAAGEIIAVVYIEQFAALAQIP